MRSKILLIILLCVSKFSFAQISESSVIIDSTSKSACYFETDLSESNVRDAIKAYFDSLNVKMEKGTGFIFKKQLPFLQFKNAVATNMNGNAMDFYFQVDTKKQKGPDVTTVYIAASKGYNNFISSSNNDNVWNNFKAFADYLRNNYFQQVKLQQSMALLLKQWKKDNDKLNDILKDKTKTEASLSDESKQLSDYNNQLQILKNTVK
jgi:hypothetical protein